MMLRPRRRLARAKRAPCMRILRVRAHAMAPFPKKTRRVTDKRRLAHGVAITSCPGNELKTRTRERAENTDTRAEESWGREWPGEQVQWVSDGKGACTRLRLGQNKGGQRLKRAHSTPRATAATSTNLLGLLCWDWAWLWPRRARVPPIKSA